MLSFVKDLSFPSFSTTHFDVYPVADTDSALLELCYRVRHQVYCLDKGWETPSLQHNGLEIDAYDSCSLHSLVTQRNSLIPVGTSRVIFTENGSLSDLPSARLLDKSTKNKLTGVLGDDSVVEISRLAFTSTHSVPDSRFDKPITLVAYASLSVFLRHRVPAAVALMRPALIRHLSKHGIPFQQIGNPINHRGRRYITYLKLEDFTKSLRSVDPDVHRFFVSNIL